MEESYFSIAEVPLSCSLTSFSCRTFLPYPKVYVIDRFSRWW